MSGPHQSIMEIFGSNVFNDTVMAERLPKEVYESLRHTIDEGKPLDAAIADVVAGAMKDWAIEKGATHYCHWFQPLTGLTAEKHDAFISPTANGKILMEFSGKELTKGEPDASSFPSGGLRATFEARGYTAWDCTSPVFIKEDGTNITLYIPSAFCSYTGEVLDKKTPLLRSMEVLNRQAMRVLRIFGNTTSKSVRTALGPEQEYFLVDRLFFKKRLDLAMAKRTLFGAPPPRGQEMEDHYFGTLHERIASFMNAVNIELWKLGVAAKTQHNEVAPAQYEIAPVYTTANIATDHNQLIMETLEKMALKHSFVCLLHEKPFVGVNGSGKHINWSMITDDGINLLNPGHTPHENMVFMVFLCAVMRAVDKYAKLLRASVANVGNEHRLGANEAPPAIISVFLGDQLTDILEQLAGGAAKSSKHGGELKLGVRTLPPLPKDCTDRNRTSPFAFTGNRFEFRMAGSSQSPADPATVLNTIAAETLSEIADELEKASNVRESAQKILQRIAKAHRRIVFNGDNYAPEWAVEAKKRGLPNIPSTVEALIAMMDKESVEVFDKHKVLSPAELKARTEILLDAYSKSVNIEARTMLNMAQRQIMPACLAYSQRLGDTVNSIKKAGGAADVHRIILKRVCGLIGQLHKGIEMLERNVDKASAIEECVARAEDYRSNVLPAMVSVRKASDELETIVDAELWPLPTYAEMLFLT